MKKIYTCVDIGSDTVRILVSEDFQGKQRTLAVSSVRSKGVKNGVIVDEDALIERIRLAIDDINSRMERIATVASAKGSSGQYNENKWAKYLSTGVQVGSIILMILAMIL